MSACNVMSAPDASIRQSLVVYAKDKRRVSAFYRRTLGLVAVEDESTHDLLRGAGIELVVHAIPQEYASHISIANPPRVREETPLKPVFRVESLEAVRLAAESAGGSLQPTDRARQYNGAIVLDGCDPEGNVVQFRQYDDT
jgi:catechol 2,3-dioxygenase-like lactoylglutathione lyase family enzyme